MSKKFNKKPKDIGIKTPTKKIKLGKADKRGKAPENVANQFKPGNKLGGRPKGARNKFAEEFFKDFYEDWTKNGAAAIKSCREEDVVAYVKIASSLVPKELNVTDSKAVLDKMLEKLSGSQLDDFIAGLVAAGAECHVGNSEASSAANQTRSQSDKVH